MAQVQEKYEESKLYRIRHSTAHVMAQAVLEMFPEGKVTIGPPVENGFYYDFDLPRNLTPEDLEQIEKRMRQIVQGGHEFKKTVISAEEAKKIFAGQPYKIELIEGLEKGGFDFEIYGRPKSIHSIWNKIKKKGVSFEEVYDLFAIRVILHSAPEKEKEDCWKVYSLITDEYTPSPERLRDWLSNPKANGYEALHTTVMGPQGKWVEVQIRTKRMNEIAEKGLAAHYKYKEGSTDESRFDKWFQQIREVISNQETDTVDFLQDFKTSFLAEEIGPSVCFRSS